MLRLAYHISPSQFKNNGSNYFHMIEIESKSLAEISYLGLQNIFDEAIMA